MDSTMDSRDVFDTERRVLQERGYELVEHPILVNIAMQCPGLRPHLVRSCYGPVYFRLPFPGCRPKEFFQAVAVRAGLRLRRGWNRLHSSEWNRVAQAVDATLADIERDGWPAVWEAMEALDALGS